MSGHLIKYVGKLSYCFFIKPLVQVEAASLWDGAAGEAAEIVCASTLCFSDAVTQSVKLAFTPNGSVSIFDIQSVTVPGVWLDMNERLRCFLS